MTTITTRTVEYPADGLTMLGHLALPAGTDRRPAVLLGPEGTGLSDVERGRAETLAELGYVALAFDIHGGRYLDDPEEMLARCMPLLADPDRMRGIGHAALDVLRAEPRVDPGDDREADRLGNKRERDDDAGEDLAAGLARIRAPRGSEVGSDVGHEPVETTTRIGARVGAVFRTIRGGCPADRRPG